MSILTSLFSNAWYLFFLPLAFLPILIYLFNKRKNKRIKFSSNYFLNELESTSIKKINIINILLLIIRTLIILLFILMLAKPKNFFNNTLDFTSNNKIYILIDNSFSMNEELDKHLASTIDNIFKLHNSDDYVEIVYLSDQIPIFNDQIQSFDLKTNDIESTFRGNSTFEANKILSDADMSFDNRFIYIVGDSKYRSDHIFIDQVPDTYNLIFIDLNIMNPDNLLIEDVKLQQTDFYELYEPISIDVTILNESDKYIDNRLLQLYVNDITRAEQVVNIDPMESKTFTFSITLIDYGHNLAYFKLHDLIVDDDDYYFINFEIKENQDVAVIGNHRGMIIDNVINHGLNYDNNINHYQTIKSYIESSNKESIIFLTTVDGQFNDLFSYLENMYNDNIKLIISPDINDKSFTDLAKIPLFDSDLENSNKNSLNTSICDPVNWSAYRSISPSLIKYKYLRDLFSNDSRLFKINSYIKVPISTNTIIALDDNSSLLNKYHTNNMDVYLFSISLDEDLHCLSSSNLPLKGSFVSLMNYIINNQRFNTSYTINETFIEYKPFGQSEFEIIGPDNESNIFDNSNGGRYIFDQPGFHFFKHIDNKKSVSVNIDKDELTLSQLDSLSMLKLLPLNSVIVNNRSDIELLDVNNEYRYVFLIIIVFLFIFELFLSNYILRIKKNDA